jgi:hypothetical protein
VQPEILDLGNPLLVIGEEVARDTHLVVRDLEVAPEEPNEADKQRRVGIRYADVVSSLVAFRPKQHAAADVIRRCVARATSALLLIRHASSASERGIRSRAFPLTLKENALLQQRLTLLVGKGNVANPEADRRF